MKRLGWSLVCLGLWTAALPADDVPLVDDGVVTIDPLPMDPAELAAHSGVVEVTTLEVPVCPLEHDHHACELDASGHCLDAACECLHHLPLADGGAVPGHEVMFYSLATASGVANEGLHVRNAPLPNARGPEVAAFSTAAANMPAALSPTNLDGSRSLMQEQLLRSTVPGRDPRLLGDSATRGKEPGLFNRLLVRDAAPAPVTAADQDYARRLAAIDALRDQALASGDEAQLQQADRLEQELRGSTSRGLRWFRR